MRSSVLAPFAPFVGLTPGAASSGGGRLLSGAVTASLTAGTGGLRLGALAEPRAYLAATLATAFEPPRNERRPEHPAARLRAAAVAAKTALETRRVAADVTVLQHYAEVIRDRVRDTVDGGDRAPVVVGIVRELIGDADDPAGRFLELDRRLVAAARAVRVLPDERQFAIVREMLARIDADLRGFGFELRAGGTP